MVRSQLLRACGRALWRLEHRQGLASVANPDARPPTFVFLGPPGVGKGTYSGRVSDYFGMEHIASGDLVREEMRRGTAVGKEMEALVKRGELLPDALILRVIREHVMESRSKGTERFLLDGFPRTADQAAALEQIADVQLAVNLDLREEVLVEKCLGRRMCSKCGKNYNIADIFLPATADGRPEIVMPPLSPPPECMEHMEQRSDDTEPVVRRRLEVYAREARPVERFYAERGKLLDFEIVGGIPETLPRLLDVLKPRIDVRQASARSAAA